MESNSIISYPKKKFCIDYCLFPIMGIFLVMFLSNLNTVNVKYILFYNNYIIIDYWFFIHIINTIIVVLFYPYKLSIYQFWIFVIGWEIIENFIMPTIIIPNINYNICNFKEDTKDIIGDLLAPIPASFILYYKNKIK